MSVDMLYKSTGTDTAKTMLASVGFLVAPDDIHVWAQRAEVGICKFIDLLFDHAATYTEELSNKLADMCKPYTTILTDTTFLRSKCKTLYQSTDRGRVAAEAARLHRMQFSLSRDFKLLTSHDASLAEKYDTVAESEQVFTGAKKFLQVISHMHVLFGLSGAPQLDEAKAVKERAYVVPKPLKEAVDILADKAKLPPAKRARTFKPLQ